MYLNEVAHHDPNLGRSTRYELNMRRETMSASYEDILSHTVFNLSTSTGKTVVMAMPILYHHRELIPEKYARLSGGLNKVITITNYQQFEPKTYSGKKSNPLDVKLKFMNSEMVRQKGKEEVAYVFSRMLGKNMKGKHIVIINDEAPRCYLPKWINSKMKSVEEQGTDEERREQNS